MRYKGQIYVYIIHTYNNREHGSRSGSKEEEEGRRRRKDDEPL